MTIGALHRAAVLVIAADAPIPGLPITTASRPPDLFIHLESPAPWQHLPVEEFYRSEYLNAEREPIVTVGRTSRGFRFLYADGTVIWIEKTGDQIWCRSATGATLEDTAIYLTGPVLGFILRQRGHLALHASAVQIGGGALAIVGPHGAGKSTTAAALVTRGFPLIADDVMHVRRTTPGWVAEPYAPGLRLWPDAVGMVLGHGASLPRLTPTWDKRLLEVDGVKFMAATEPVVVHAVLFIEEAEPANDAPCFVRSSAAETVVRLAAHSSASHLLNDSARAREFQSIVDLVRSIRSVQTMIRGRPDSFQGGIDRIQQWAVDAVSVRDR